MLTQNERHLLRKCRMGDRVAQVARDEGNFSDSNFSMLRSDKVGHLPWRGRAQIYGVELS